MNISELTSEQKALFKEAALPVYDQYKDKIGADLVDRMLEAVK
jgi:TRAP-type C4-dicarboxylate transport system substrate-binding protein